jgi:tetratricopeptide (TPR) repeat protein
MKKILSSVLFVFLFFMASAQDAKLNEIGQEGIRLHDAGQYNEAIEMYKKGLAIDKKSTFFHYEIGYSYSALKNYKKAIYHAKKALKTKDQNSLSSYVLLGNCYDYIGQTKKSIATYEKAIASYPDAPLLHFNYGITLYGQGMRAKAETQFLESVALNPSHTSSNYYLGLLKADQGMKTQAHLALYFFLLLEPDSERSENALRVLDKISKANITKEGKNEINITLEMLEGGNTDFMASDLLLSFGGVQDLIATATEEGETATEDETEKVERTESEKFYDRLVGILDALESKREGKKGVWWEIYYDLFTDLKATDNLEAFSYFITQKRGLEVEKWMQDNEAKMEKLGLYFEE